MVYTNELYHHGIKGQKWGVRRFQNADGSRTAAGKKRESMTRKKATAENAEKLVGMIKSGRGVDSEEYKRVVNSVVKGGVDSEFDKMMGESKKYADKLHADADANYYPKLNRYSTIAGNASADRHGETDPAARDATIKAFVYDDLDQGMYNSYDYYLCAKGTDPNKFNKEYAKVLKRARSEAERVAGDLLGDKADEPVEYYRQQTTAKKVLASSIDVAAYEQNGFWGPWEESGGTYSKEEIAQMKADTKRYANTPIPEFRHSDTQQNYLIHHGIKGQKWGLRRFQNPDGSRTPAGAARELKRYQRKELRTLDRMNRRQTRKEDRQIAKAQIKMARLATKGGPLFRKTLVAKRQNQIDDLKQKKLYRQGIYASERARVMRMTIDDVDRERAGLMKSRGERSVTQMFSKGRLDREFKTNQRVTEEQRQNAYSNAYMLRSAIG